MGEHFSFPALDSGGVITNYFCTSRCRHCLYNCSPYWPKDYIDGETALGAFSIAARLGCGSMHIGGGEPFLRFESLLQVCSAARKAGIWIEYVETNSSWFRQADEAVSMLRALKDAGVSTLLISISPFHNEFIPFSKVKGVMEACRQAGMGIFPWVSGFIKDLSRLDPARSHSIEEYEAIFGPGYLESLPDRYWIVMRGRALETFKGFRTTKSAEELADGAGPCSQLMDTSHFHMDLYGNYIPGLCSGLALPINDLEGEIECERYPLLCRLIRQGPGALLSFAQELGFKPDDSGYISKCHLCQEIRGFLIKAFPGRFRELAPKWFYEDHPG